MSLIYSISIIFFIFIHVNCQDYSNKFKNVNVEEILKNERLLLNNHKCLVEGVGCTPDGENLRLILPDILETGCAKCTESQRESARIIGKFLIEKRPDLWNELMEKYDPDKKFRAAFEKQFE